MGLKKFIQPVASAALMGGAGSTFLGGPVGSFLGGSSIASGSGLGGILFGKDQVQKADDIAGELKQTQLEASLAQRGGLRSLMQQDPKQFAESQIAQQGDALKSNLEDTRRQIQQNIARRGLQNTSLGQIANTAATRDIGKKINLLQASSPLLQNQYANELINAGAKVSAAQNVPIRFEDEITKKQGIAGLLGMLGGAGLGAMAGGPQGAAAGGQVGYGAGTGLSGIFG